MEGKDFTIDWGFPFSILENLSDVKTQFCLCFASDLEGNSFHLYDARNVETPILYNSHDPEVLFVIAESFCQFITDLKAFAEDNPKDVLERYFDHKEVDKKINDISQIKDNPSLIETHGMLLKVRPKSLLVDFSQSRFGDGISLSFFGNLTKMQRNLKQRSISLIKPSEKELAKHRHDELITRIPLAFLPLMTYIFLTISFQYEMPLWQRALWVVSNVVVFSIGASFLIWLVLTIFYHFRK